MDINTVLHSSDCPMLQHLWGAHLDSTTTEVQSFVQQPDSRLLHRILADLPAKLHNSH